MKRNPVNSHQDGETRRDFIKKTAAATALVAAGNILGLPARAQNNSASIALVWDAGDALVKQPPVRWAADYLCGALKGRGVSIQTPDRLDKAAHDCECILVGRHGYSPALRPTCRTNPTS